MKLFPVATKHGYLTLLGVRLAADGSVRFVFVDVTPCVCVCVCVCGPNLPAFPKNVHPLSSQ